MEDNDVKVYDDIIKRVQSIHDNFTDAINNMNTLADDIKSTFILYNTSREDIMKEGLDKEYIWATSLTNINELYAKDFESILGALNSIKYAVYDKVLSIQHDSLD